MNYSPSMKTGRDLFFSYEGKIGRTDFWVAQIFLGVIVFVAVLIGIGIDELLYPNLLGLFGVAVWFLAMIFGMWCSLVLQIKRLHDLGKSGWWLLLYLTYFGIVLLLYWYLCKPRATRTIFSAPPQAVAASRAQLENYNQQLAEYNLSLQKYHNYSSQQNDPRQQQIRELQQQTKHLQDMDSLKREMDELKYNQLKQEMERLTSEMKTEKQQINISVERIGDTIQDSVVSGYNKVRDTPEKDETEEE
jgi:uncharacterized membrane protein YhaH (DUF805 family)